MIFRNALVYRLTQTIDLTALGDALASKEHREPASQELSTYGFIPPYEGHSEFVQTYNGGKVAAHLIAAKKTERILPGSVIRDELKKKVDTIEAEQLRKVYKKERDQLKDELIQTLLPNAFLRHKVTRAMFLGEYIVVDATSPRAAEDLLSTVREVLGSLPVRPATVKIAPSASMTDWVKAQGEGCPFYLLDQCELRDTGEDGGTVRCNRQDLTSEEIQLHLGTGKLVTKLALAWQEKLSFILDDKLSIKRLRFEDLLVEKAEQDGGDDAHGQFIASLAIFSGTIYELFAELFVALGGEEQPTGV